MNRKYKLHPGQYEIGENEKFYSAMEAKGWRLVKRGAYFSRFERVEPADTRYRIEVFHPGAWADRNLPEEQKAVYEDCGWEHVCSSLPLHIFRAPAGSGAPEFYNDPAQQAETLRRMKRDAVWGWIPTLAVWAFWLWMYLLLDGPSKFAAEFRVHLVQLTWLFLLAGVMLLQWFYSQVRSAWTITRTYRRLKEGVPLDHNPQGRHTVHKAVSRTLTVLVILCAFLLASQLIRTRSTDLPETADGPYLLLSDLGWEANREQETSVTHTRSLLADYWDVMERPASWNGEPWIYQDIYRLRSPSMANWLAEALVNTATLSKPEQFQPIEAEGLDMAWTNYRNEVVAVKGDMAAYIAYMPGTSPDFDPRALCEALAARWS